MPEEIVSGIYRIPVPLAGNPLKELNAYLLKGADGNLLIDTGFRQPACREALFSGLRELGVRRGEVEVLLTHLHSDHAGLAPEAAGERTIYISEVDRPSLDDRSYREKYWGIMDVRFREEGFPRHLMAKMNETNPARSMAPPSGGHYEGLADGQILEKAGCSIQCLLMPGHTPGQMCYWLPERGILFTGDHVLFDITPNITIELSMENPLQDYLDESYASPGIKRAIHQVMGIVNELEGILKCPPKRVFVEVAREHGEKGKRTISRKNELLALYQKCGEECDELFQQLSDEPEGSLRRDMSTAAAGP